MMTTVVKMYVAVFANFSKFNLLTWKTPLSRKISKQHYTNI